ncbi:phosphatase PAP2 family protein [Luteococcus sp. Sow4_B9]|uniref:phosphatase PAP2 family protein n=1 Tax=Luteococcus sp. Sow4_B9 TaxID=3438792 RepID=UPI003F9794C6
MSTQYSAWRWLRPLLLCGASAAAVLGVWYVFVLTRRGQVLDTLAYIGAEFGSDRVTPTFEQILEVVSVSAIALVMVAVGLTALLRRRWFLALEATAVVAGANLATQVLKYKVLYRPPLVNYQGLTSNTYPSGHTTAAASAMVAALLVAPRGLSSVIAVVGSGVMVVFGYGTLAARWHRPSDVVGAYLVCFTLAFGAIFLAALRQAVMARRQPLPPERPVPSRLVPGLMVAAGAVALGVAAACGWLSRSTTADFSDPYQLESTVAQHTHLIVAYLGAAAGVCGVAVAGMGVLLRLVQLHELRSGRPS